MYSRLITFISSFINISDSEINDIKTMFEYMQVSRNFVLLDFNELAAQVFFINSGYIRYYYVRDAEEQTVHLFAPGEFATSFRSFMSCQRTEAILQCITDCQLLVITRDNLEKLYQMGAKWQEFGRKLMQQLLLEKESRILDQIADTAAQRYLRLVEEKPDLVKNVPIQYIASYIGIQPESLSRIRKSIFS